MNIKLQLALTETGGKTSKSATERHSGRHTLHDCLSLGPGARKPARNKVTPLQCANAATKLVIGRICSDCGWLERVIAFLWWSAAAKWLKR